MPRYEIRPKQPTLIDGRSVSGEDVIAYVATELPPRDVIAMVTFGSAIVVEVSPEKPAKAKPQPAPEPEPAPEPVVEATPEPEAEPEAQPAGDFAGYSAKAQAGLAAAGITTLAQAALHLRDHGTFEPLDGIGRVANKQLVAQIKAAGLPVE